MPSIASNNSNTLSAELKLLLALSKLKLTDSNIEEARLLSTEIKDWKCFFDRSVASYLSPIIYKNIGLLNANVPENVTEAIQNSYNQVLARNIRLYEAFKSVLSILETAQIRSIPLKGIYLAEAVFKDLGLRHLSDIDLLVKSEDTESICDLMSDQGWGVKAIKPKSKFEEEQFTLAHPFTFFKDGVTIELHTHLYNSNQGATITEEQLWLNAQKEAFLNNQIYQFNNEMLLQHLCLHLHKHIVGSEAKLINFCDIRELISQRENSIDWTKFKRLCEEFKCHNEVAQILYICRLYWSVQIPDTFFENTVLDQNVNDKFLRFLNGNASNQTQYVENNVTKTFATLNSIESVSGKLRFVVGFIFPSSEFMRRQFQLSPKRWLFPYYALRVLQLTAKLLTAAVNRISNFG